MLYEILCPQPCRSDKTETKNTVTQHRGFRKVSWIPEVYCTGRVIAIGLLFERDIKYTAFSWVAHTTVVLLPTMPGSDHGAREMLGMWTLLHFAAALLSSWDTGCVSKGGTASFQDGCFLEKGLETATAIKKRRCPRATSGGQTRGGGRVPDTKGPAKRSQPGPAFLGRWRLVLRPCGQRGRGTPRRLTRCPPRPCRPVRAGQSRGGAAGAGPGLACCPAGSSPSLCLVSF